MQLDQIGRHNQLQLAILSFQINFYNDNLTRLPVTQDQEAYDYISRLTVEELVI